ncbi:MAG TPA: DUF4349 domain-containing protein [Planctomycetota bacterium]|nr:DUF4349 domain-containing protein [Planctomycetota bacterium]
MNCQHARTLIDDRVHGSLATELHGELDEHLKDCADCREDLRQLSKVRELLQDVRKDAPSKEKLAAMFETIRARTQKSASGTHERKPAMSASYAVRHQEPKPITNRRWKLVAAASLAACALLLVSFMIGSMNYGPKVQDALRKKGPVAQAAGAKAYAEADELSKELVYDRDGVADYAQRLQSRNKSVPPPAAAAEGADKGGGLYYDPHAADGKPAESFFAESLEKKAKESVSGKLGGSLDAPTAPPLPGSPKQDRDERNSDNKEANKPVVVSSVKVKNLREGDPAKEGKDGDPTGAAAQSKPKIIKTGELTLEVKNFTEASRAADALVIKVGGFIADSRTFDLPGATKRGEIVIRVNPDKFEELFAELKKLGIVLNERAGGQDITAAYTDTQARIKNLQIAEERLQELIKSKSFIDKIQSLLEVERELSRVRGEIESMQGQMRVWENQLSLSTIRLTLTEPSRPVPSGSMSVEVAALSDAKKHLDAAISNAGGQLTSGQTSKRGDGTLMGTYGVRVKFARFAEVLTAIRGLGRVQDEQLQNQPVGGVVPEGAGDVFCDVSLVLFERSIQLPSASIYLEVSSMTDAISRMNQALSDNQGSLVSNQTQRQPDGTTRATVTVRVRAGNFSALLDSLSALGRLTNRSVTGEAGKIQGGAADVPVQINLSISEQRKQVPSGSMGVEVEKFTAARDSLSAIIKDQGLQVLGSDSQQRADNTWAGSFRLGIRADKMDETVTSFEKLGRVKTRNLQGLGLGDLSKVDPSVFGEVVLFIEEKPALAPQEEGAFRMMLRDTFGGFLHSMGLIVRGLGMILPWLLMGGLFIWIIWRYTRSAAAPVVTPTTPPTPPASNVAPPSEKSDPRG